jgi:hypothetical protein
MFRKNDNHKQLELFNSSTFMDEGIRRRLDNSWAPIFYEHVFCQIDEEPFAVLYDKNWGRPNFPVNILVGLEIIKAFRDYTDEELVEQFFFNLQLKWALGIRDIGECPVAERTLYEFRERLYSHALAHPGEEDLVHQQFMLISEHLMEFLKLSTEEMRMDSTQIMPNIRRAGRLSLAFDVLLKAVKACPIELLPQHLSEVMEPEFKKKLLYRIKAREITDRLTGLLQLCAELVELVTVHKELEEKEALRILVRFLSEQADFDNESQRWVAKKTKPGSNILQSANDPDATYRKKGKSVHVGYVANLAETCADENPVQLLSDYIFEKNNVADTTMAQKSLPRLAKHYGTTEVYVDGGYSGETVHDTAEEHEISMYYTNMTGRESSKILSGYFKIEGNKITHCPAGYPSELSYHDEKTGKITAHFNLELCQNCEGKEVCPIKFLRKSTVVVITRKQRIAQKTRRQIEDKEQHRVNTSKRAGIEGTNSAVKRKHGAEKLAVRGHHKCQIVFGFKALAHNFKQTVRCKLGDIRRSLIDKERELRKNAFRVPPIANEGTG